MVPTVILHINSFVAKAEFSLLIFIAKKMRRENTVSFFFSINGFNYGLRAGQKSNKSNCNKLCDI